MMTNIPSPISPVRERYSPPANERIWPKRTSRAISDRFNVGNRCALRVSKVDGLFNLPLKVVRHRTQLKCFRAEVTDSLLPTRCHLLKVVRHYLQGGPSIMLL